MLHFIKKTMGIALSLMSVSACASPTQNDHNTMTTQETLPTTPLPTAAAGTEIVTFGAGCFWCVEAIFQDIPGVLKVESGYSGGKIKNPTYREVCGGMTGHAEVCQLTYDPQKVSFETLLEVFWMTHDPTTLNRQGADVGTQYRSAIFFHTEKQQELAEAWKKKLNDQKVFPNPIVTEITAFSNFYKAEDYHQNYYKDNGYEPYCQVVIKPKMDKFKKVFKERFHL